MFKYFLVVILLGCSTVAHAVGYDGNKLYHEYVAYAAKNYDLDAGVYIGYIMGVSDSLEGIVFCIPEPVKIEQYWDIVGQYLTNHPEKRQQDALSLVRIALSEAFPCKK